jgi:hypothetical protein
VLKNLASIEALKEQLRQDEEFTMLQLAFVDLGVGGHSPSKFCQQYIMLLLLFISKAVQLYFLHITCITSYKTNQALLGLPGCHDAGLLHLPFWVGQPCRYSEH